MFLQIMLRHPLWNPPLSFQKCPVTLEKWPLCTLGWGSSWPWVQNNLHDFGFLTDSIKTNFNFGRFAMQNHFWRFFSFWTTNRTLTQGKLMFCQNYIDLWPLFLLTGLAPAILWGTPFRHVGNVRGSSSCADSKVPAHHRAKNTPCLFRTDVFKK